MLGEIAQYIVVNLFIAFVLGILVGYLIGRRKEKFSKINASNTGSCCTGEKRFRMNPIFNKSASLDYKPMVLSSSSLKDNLKKIKGIDEDLESALYELGIYQFNQISNWTKKNSEWIENFLNLPNYVRNHQWIEQAKILRTGKETNYSQSLLDEENTIKEEQN
ncbi:hypothetical protein CRU92_05475 [Arcobacter sp. FW59]|nr:hypothetical protein CRU92_05475 [Arcobacter sp. FW59]